MDVEYTYTDCHDAIIMALEFIAWLKDNNDNGYVLTEEGRAIIQKVGVETFAGRATRVIVKAYLPDEDEYLVGVEPHVEDDCVMFDRYSVASSNYTANELWRGSITLTEIDANLR